MVVAATVNVEFLDDPDDWLSRSPPGLSSATGLSSEEFRASILRSGLTILGRPNSGRRSEPSSVPRDPNLDGGKVNFFVVN